MSTVGLVRRPTYEEVLNAAIKDDQTQHGLLSVPMQGAASRAVNNPLFQRVKQTMTEELDFQQKAVLEQRGFENNLTRLSVEARVPKEDLQYIVENLQRPPPPPPAPVNPVVEARIDYERMAAEMDALAQKRNVETSHRALAAELRQELQAQAVATPLQQIVHNHHTMYVSGPTPAPQPMPMVQPRPNTLSGTMRDTGKSAHEIFVSGGGGPPPPPPGAGAVRMNNPVLAQPAPEPLQVGSTGSAPPPPPPAARASRAAPLAALPPRGSAALIGGATGPYPVPPARVPAPPVEVPKRRNRPQRMEEEVEIRQAVKRPIVEATGGGKKPRVPRFPGQGYHLDLGPSSSDGPPKRDRPGFAAFSGKAARLPEDVPTAHSAPSQSVRDAALARMKDVYKRKQQETTRGKAFAQRVAEEAKKRRGGAPGDVVPLGKRKEREPEMPRSILRKPAAAEGPRARQRVYGPRTEVFNMAA